MSKLTAISFLSFFFLLFAVPAQAGIWTCNLNGTEKNSFYTNESVYLTSDNITGVSKSVRIYIVANTESWVNGSVLNDVSTGYKSVYTNSSGYLEPTVIWGAPSVGDYDVVVDLESDGIYNTTDYVDSTSEIGFTVILTPIPSLTVSAGANNPASHSWDLDNASHNVMFQAKLAASSVENVRVNSISLISGGTGDDKKGISMVKLVLDANDNGAYEADETLLSYGKFLSDNAILTMDIADGYTIPASASVNMLIVYTMSNENSHNDTFYLQLASMAGVGAGSGQALTVYGLPITSGTKTIVAPTTTTTAQPTTTTTTTTTTTQPTTTITQEETITTTAPSEEVGIGIGGISINITWIIIIVVIIVGLIVFFLFFRLTTKRTSEFGLEEG